MTDEDLCHYFARHGDRLAVRSFCRTLHPHVNVREHGECNRLEEAMNSVRAKTVNTKIKSQSLRAIVGLCDTSGKAVGAPECGRRIELGWKNFIDDTYKQVRFSNGGGIRHMKVSKDLTMSEILGIGFDLFFPNGTSSKGLDVAMFDFEVQDFAGN